MHTLPTLSLKSDALPDQLLNLEPEVLIQSSYRLPHDFKKENPFLVVISSVDRHATQSLEIPYRSINSVRGPLENTSQPCPGLSETLLTRHPILNLIL